MFIFALILNFIISNFLITNMRFAFYTAVALAATIASLSKAIKISDPEKQKAAMKPEIMSQFVM